MTRFLGPLETSYRPDPFSEAAIDLLSLSLGWAAQRCGARIALAESCTGGLASSWVTRLTGSSQWFEGAVVSYSNAVKVRRLHVPESLLEAHGAVSQPVVQAMAEGLGPSSRGPFLTAAITGVAGPGGGTKDKPVGLVWFAWAEFDGQQRQSMPLRCWTSQQQFLGDRQAIQRQAAWYALQGLLSHLQGRGLVP
jgi:nicotinamide-nucleotide amidase